MTAFEEIFVISEIDPFGNVPGVSSLGCESLTSQNLCVIDVPSSMINVSKDDRLKVHMQTIQSDATTNYLQSNSEGSDLAVRGLILNIKNDNGRVCLQASVCGMDLVLEAEETCVKRFSIHDEILLCIKKL